MRSLTSSCWDPIAETNLLVAQGRAQTRLIIGCAVRRIVREGASFKSLLLPDLLENRGQGKLHLIWRLERTESDYGKRIWKFLKVVSRRKPNLICSFLGLEFGSF